MNTFKAGDKVYCPSVSTEVFKLVENNSEVYPVRLDEIFRTFTSNGARIEGVNNLPVSIFHATVENKEKLESLYGVTFEDAPKVMVTVSFELPEPFEPKIGEVYWYLNTSGKSYWHHFQNDKVDNSILFKWRTEEEVKQAILTIQAKFGMPL